MTDKSNVTHVLYVVPGDPNSERAIGIVQWGPNETSADGTILFQDVRMIKRMFGALPDWLRVVPTLGQIDTRTVWCGSACIAKLQEWRDEWVSFRKQKELSGPTNVRGSLGTPSVIEDTPVVLPPDPRDALVQESRQEPRQVSRQESVPEIERDIQLQPRRSVGSDARKLSSGSSFIRDDRPLEIFAPADPATPMIPFDVDETCSVVNGRRS